MAQWIDAVFRSIDLTFFTALHSWAVATGESAGAEITSWLTHLMKFISFFAHDGICMFVLGALLMLPKRTRPVGFCVFLAVCCGGLITNITLKPLIARIRPYANFDHLAATVNEWWVAVGEARKGERINSSFPSGHTTSAMAAMTALFLTTNKKYSWSAFIFAALMGLSRMYLMVHYPTDVLGGLIAGAIGAVGGYFLSRWMLAVCERHADKALFHFVLSFDLAALLARLLHRKPIAESGEASPETGCEAVDTSSEDQE